MPRLHQVERQLLDQIALACPSVYDRWFKGWIDCDRKRREAANDGLHSKDYAPSYRERCRGWYIMSDAVDEAGFLQLAALMRTMPTILPMAQRWRMHQREVDRQERAVPRTDRGRRRGRTMGSYTSTPVTIAFTNHDRSCLELFDILLNRPSKIVSYVRLPSERSLWTASMTTYSSAPHRQSVRQQRGTIGTWNGISLGTCTTGEPYQNNLGGGRVSVAVESVNGCRYHGTYYYTSGDYSRLTMHLKDWKRVQAGQWDFHCPLLEGGNPVQFPPDIDDPAPEQPIAALQ